MHALVDNDILVKGACYGLLEDVVLTVVAQPPIGILGAAPFVVPKSIDRQKVKGSRASAHLNFKNFLANATALEPTHAEQKLAAEVEAHAQKLAVNLDTGESQLVAILVSRSVPALLTGDKRAVAGLEVILDELPELSLISGRVHCLEQCMHALVQREDDQKIRAAICAEPDIDKALTICFSCASEANATAICAALQQYIEDLRSRAARVLAK